MKKHILCVLIFSILVCHGCIYIPAIYTKSGTPIDPSFITVGVTTKEDVVQRCGNPSVTSDDEKIFTYRWNTAGGVFVGLYMPVVALEYATSLNIYFDENDIVKDYNLEKKNQSKKY